MCDPTDQCSLIISLHSFRREILKISECQVLFYFLNIYEHPDSFLHRQCNPTPTLSTYRRLCTSSDSTFTFLSLLCFLWLLSLTSQLTWLIPSLWYCVHTIPSWPPPQCLPVVVKFFFPSLNQLFNWKNIIYIYIDILLFGRKWS